MCTTGIPSWQHHLTLDCGNTYNSNKQVLLYLYNQPQYLRDDPLAFGEAGHTRAYIDHHSSDICAQNEWPLSQPGSTICPVRIIRLTRTLHEGYKVQSYWIFQSEGFYPKQKLANY